MLAADVLSVGAVYVEADLGSDNQGDLFEINFNGGAADTQLTRIVIDGNQAEPAFGRGDVFFDSVSTGLGADNGFDFRVVDLQTADPNATVAANVIDGSTRLEIDLTNFHAGDKLTFSIDVDEVEILEDTDDLQRLNEGFDPITSGLEFQGSKFVAQFTAPHFEDGEATSEFRNNYDQQFDPLGLDLPLDDADGQRDRTAGAATQLQQIEKPISISGTVYHDENLNLQQDGSEAGIEDVTVELFHFDESTGQFQSAGHSTQTDSDGNYRFGTDLLLPTGVYEVREQQPADFFSVGAVPGSVDGSASGSVPVGNVNQLTDIIVPHGDNQAIDFDFAEALPVAVSGHVFVDHNNNGERDPTEPGIAGVRVELQPVDTLVSASPQSLTTDSDGFYSFVDLSPGLYTLVEAEQPVAFLDGREQVGVVQGAPVGIADDLADTISAVFLPGGALGTEYNFGEIEPGSLSGRVHLTDPDGNCFSTDAQPIDDVTIRLFDESGALVSETLTDSSGEYRFTGLPSGTYSIVEVTPAGLLDGTNHLGNLDASASIGAVVNGDSFEGIQLLAGQQGTEFNFCEHLPASLSGHVFHDENADGFRGNDESPIANVEIILLDDSGTQLQTTQTDSDGFYLFDQLASGTYWIDEVQPATWLDAEETIGLVAGVHTGAFSPDGDGFREIGLRWGDGGIHFDFGEVKPGSISGVVHSDEDGDCEVDPGEQLLAGVTIELLDVTGGIVATTETNVDGVYEFNDLAPGMYSVREVQPDGFFDSGQVAGSQGGDSSQSNLIAGVRIGSGQSLVGYNFCEELPASISGVVHVDTNTNCEIDGDESPISGVTIELLDADGIVVATMFTDDEGRYEFVNLRGGVYSVREQQPDEFFDGGQNIHSLNGDVSSDDLIAGIVLQPGDRLSEFNFCEVPAGRISGFVFQDGQVVTTSDGSPPPNLYTIRDGSQSPDDTPLAGVELELRDGLQGLPLNGSIILGNANGDGPIRTVTDETGFYEFVGLPRGNYSVFQVQPDGYIDGIDTPGTGSGVAFNPNQQVSEAVLQTMLSNPRNDAIVRIQLGAGDHAALNNFSEVLVNAQPIPPIPPLPPSLPPTLTPPIQPPAPLIVAAAIPPVASGPAGMTLPVIFINTESGVGTPDFTWHLSIIDGGSPRGESELVSINPGSIHSVGFMPRHEEIKLDDAEWVTRTPRGDQFEIKTHVFGLSDGIPVVGDFNGDGASEFGVFRDGEWFIDLNGNGLWDKNDIWARLGDIGDMPAIGDWDADGKDDIAVHGPAWPGDDQAIDVEPGLPDPENLPSSRPKNPPPVAKEATTGGRLLQIPAKNIQRGDLIDHVFRFGSSDQLPVAGDWNGDGVSTIGVYRDGTWRLDIDGDGKFTEKDEIFGFGRKGDIPLVGDFDGDGRDDVGVYRAGKWIIDSNHDRELDAHDKVFEFGGVNDRPVVGDWDGDGTDDAGLYRRKAG